MLASKALASAMPLSRWIPSLKADEKSSLELQQFWYQNGTHHLAGHHLGDLRRS